MTTKPPSPRITHFEWGTLIVDGQGEFKDAKLFPGGAMEWDWNLTGTRHVPGIQPADTDDLIDHGAEVIVLSKGVHERLMTMLETLAYLGDKSIVVHVLQTEKAVEEYNRLAELGEAVGALIHSTC